MSQSIFTVLLAWASLVASAQPQDPQPKQNAPKQQSFLQSYVGMGLGSSLHAMIGVCRYPEVQTELKMTDAQKKKFLELDAKTAREGRRKADDFLKKKLELGPDGDQQARLEVIEAEKAARAAATSDGEKALKKILDHDQFVRLGQIRFQAEGPRVFTRPEVLEKLLLEPQDVEKIQAIIAEGEIETAQASLIPTDVMPADKRSLRRKEKKAKLESKAYQDRLKSFRNTASEVRSNTMQKIAKVLSKGQRARFEKLVGEHFDFSKTWGKPAPQPPAVVVEPSSKEAVQPTRKP